VTVAWQIHGIDGELLCEKRRQRSEILELGTNCVEEDQRWSLARLLIAEAEFVRNPKKSRFDGETFAVAFYHVVSSH
jgi:hypothetical protein